jgi:hypothetical protein
MIAATHPHGQFEQAAQSGTSSATTVTLAWPYCGVQRIDAPADVVRQELHAGRCRAPVYLTGTNSKVGGIRT